MRLLALLLLAVTVAVLVTLWLHRHPAFEEPFEIPVDPWCWNGVDG